VTDVEEYCLGFSQKDGRILAASIIKEESMDTESEWLAPELAKLAEELRAGKPVEPVTVRTFLWWFEAKRRGPHVVRYVRDQLARVNVATYPDFEGLWLDAPIGFILAAKDRSEVECDKASEKDQQEAHDEPLLPWITRDPTHRISKLAAANQKVVSVTPNDPFEKVVTLLLARDFSQLPVMTSDRTVKGIVSWKSIGSRLSLGKQPVYARDCMVEHHEVRANQSLFEAIPLIQTFDYVLVRAEDQIISGIITASDLSSQFYSLSEPFLLLSEIENLIRNMIGGKFTAAELQSAKDPSDTKLVSTVDDLTFGGYLRLLENSALWQKVGINIDRSVFCTDLNNVRTIRNNVTHFDPDGITEDELEKLRDFKAFLHNLEKMV
jgi:predicted transcriptional regulator